MPWEDVKYVSTLIDEPRVATFLGLFKGEAPPVAELRGDQIYGQRRCLLRSLQATEPQVFDTAWGSDIRPPASWLKDLLETPSVRTALRPLAVPVPAADLPIDASQNAFEFEGTLTGLLMNTHLNGGNVFPEEQARDLSRAFVEGLLGPGRHMARIFRIEGPWTPWFVGVFLDTTFLILDHDAHRWIVLCYTLS